MQKKNTYLIYFQIRVGDKLLFIYIINTFPGPLSYDIIINVIVVNSIQFNFCNFNGKIYH